MSGRSVPSRALGVSSAATAAPIWRSRSTIGLFIGFALTFLAWSLITPLGGSPDEPAHFQQGYATVTGQTFNSSSVDKIPAALAEIRADCYAFQPAKSANCFRPNWSVSGKVGVQSTAAGYPPVYYALTAWPLLLPEPFGAYGARLLSALLVAAVAVLMAEGVARLVAARWARFGLLALLTPQLAWFGGMYNPQALETLGVAAVAVWTTIGLSRLAEGDAPTRREGAVFAVLVAVVCLSRPLSFAWVPIVMALAAGWVWAHHGTAGFPRRLLQGLRGQRLLTAYCAGSILLGAAWFAVGRLQPWLTDHTTTPAPLGIQSLPPTSLLGGLRRAVDVVSSSTLQAVGVFGWVDTQLPLMALVLLFALAMLPIFVSMAVGPPRWAVLAVLFSGLTVAIALVIDTSFEKGGTPFWQARYGWPLVAALCVLSLASASAYTRTNLRVWPLVGLWTGLHLFAWGFVWWRFAHGLTKQGSPGGSGTWATPASISILFLLFCAGLAFTLAGLGRGTAVPMGKPRSSAGLARST